MVMSKKRERVHQTAAATSAAFGFGRPNHSELECSLTTIRENRISHNHQPYPRFLEEGRGNEDKNWLWVKLTQACRGYGVTGTARAQVPNTAFAAFDR